MLAGVVRVPDAYIRDLGAFAANHPYGLPFADDKGAAGLFDGDSEFLEETEPIMRRSRRSQALVEFTVKGRRREIPFGLHDPVHFHPFDLSHTRAPVVAKGSP